MGYSPRYHIYTNEFPDQHSETDDWACVESEMRRAKESGAIKADYAAYVIDTHTGQRTYFDSTGVKSPHGGRPMTLREVMDAEAPAQPPCSECATLSMEEINLPWTVSGDSPANPPMVWDASGDSIVNQMPDGTPYFEPEVAEFIIHAANSLAAHEAECATLRKERDDSEKAITKALRFTPSEEEPEECAPWMVEAEPEPMGPFSLIEAITAMMEMFDREFSKADKRAEAAEAQLSTLRDALENKLNRALSDAKDINGYATNDEGGLGMRLLKVAGHTTGMIIRLERELKEIAAPTPEVAPKE